MFERDLIDIVSITMICVVQYVLTSLSKKTMPEIDEKFLGVGSDQNSFDFSYQNFFWRDPTQDPNFKISILSYVIVFLNFAATSFLSNIS